LAGRLPESATAGLLAAGLVVAVWLGLGRHDPAGLVVAGAAGVMFVAFGLIGAMAAQP